MSRGILVVSMVVCLILVVGSCNLTAISHVEGEKLYKIHCANCHMEDGSGLAALYPPLQKADYLQSLGVSLSCIIRNGLQEPILVNGVKYEQAMPANDRLSDVEITNICNYVLSKWTDDESYVSLERVKETLLNCQ